MTQCSYSKEYYTDLVDIKRYLQDIVYLLTTSTRLVPASYASKSDAIDCCAAYGIGRIFDNKNVVTLLTYEYVLPGPMFRQADPMRSAGDKTFLYVLCERNID